MNVEAPERFESFKRFELLKIHQFTSKTQSSKRQKPTSSSQVRIVLIGLTSYLVVNNPCCRYYLSCRQYSYGHQHLSCRQTPILLLTIPSIPPFKNFPHARPSKKTPKKISTSRQTYEHKSISAHSVQKHTPLNPGFWRQWFRWRETCYRSAPYIVAENHMQLFIAFHLIILHVRNSRPCYGQCIILASSYILKLQSRYSNNRLHVWLCQLACLCWSQRAGCDPLDETRWRGADVLVWSWAKSLLDNRL
jgi:hypothetical protein